VIEYSQIIFTNENNINEEKPISDHIKEINEMNTSPTHRRN